MSAESRFAAAVLDSTLAVQAHDLALGLKERGGEPGASFQGLVADARLRLQYLAEAVALERAGLYLQHVEWLRETRAARGLDARFLAAALECLRQVLVENLPPEAFARVAPILAEEERLLAQPLAESPGVLEGPHAAEVARLLALMLEGRRSEAVALALERARSLGEETFLGEVLVGAQRELGRLWQRGEVHAGEEHLGSRITEEILVRLGATGPLAQPHGRKVLLASAAGDLHDIGARLVARVLERDGWEACFLGANLPLEDLVLAVQDLRPDLLALSVSLGLHVRPAERVVQAVHALEPRLPVLVGGAPFRRVPDLWQVIGADAQAEDAGAAVRAARALLAL